MELQPTGPYVAVAAFCERTLQEADGVVSLLRVVDRMTVSARGEDPPPDMPPVPLSLQCVVVLKRGKARGRQLVKIRPEDPMGAQRPAAEVTIQLGGDPEQGANIIVDFSGFALDHEGLWWFDVLFGDSETLLARIPLRVQYAPQRTAQQQP